MRKSAKESIKEELCGGTLRGEKLQKVMAQSGFGSRRMMEEWIASGRVSVNGELATLGMRVLNGDIIKVNRQVICVGKKYHPARILLYHKPDGEIVSCDDPGKRATVFDKLPKIRGQKWIAIGRLDINTSGLLIFTTSGELANCLMHPRFEVEREYAVRLQGTLTDEQINQLLKQGVALTDGLIKYEILQDEGGEGLNHWYRLILKEGRNRVVRRTFEALGLTVSRLMRVRFGVIKLPPRLKRGMVLELNESEVAHLMRWAGLADDNKELSGNLPIARETDRYKPNDSNRSLRASQGVAKRMHIKQKK